MVQPQGELPRGPALVATRVAGLPHRVIRHPTTVTRKQRVPLWTEDGQPETTETGRQRFRLEPTTVPAEAVVIKIWLDGQAQYGRWVVDEGRVSFDEGRAWPNDHSDIPRAIGAAQLGTLVDLDALREQSIERARADVDERLGLAAIRARALNGGRRR